MSGANLSMTLGVFCFGATGSGICDCRVFVGSLPLDNAQVMVTWPSSGSLGVCSGGTYLRVRVGVQQ